MDIRRLGTGMATYQASKTPHGKSLESSCSERTRSCALDTIVHAIYACLLFEQAIRTPSFSIVGQ